MTKLRAVLIAEGVEEASTYEVLKAWSYLIKTGAVNELQGFFGRRAKMLIDKGYITRSGKITKLGRDLCKNSE